MYVLLSSMLKPFARKNQSLFNLFKAFDKIDSNHKSYFFFSEKTYFPVCVHNMFWVTMIEDFILKLEATMYVAKTTAFFLHFFSGEGGYPMPWSDD